MSPQRNFQTPAYQDIDDDHHQGRRRAAQSGAQSRERSVDKVCKRILFLRRQGVQFATFAETVVPY
jgi:hypothetical protein